MSFLRKVQISIFNGYSPIPCSPDHSDHMDKMSNFGMKSLLGVNKVLILAKIKAQIIKH